MIKLIDVHKAFNGQQVLRGVNLEAVGGKITVILGRSGEGKSVLLKHIIGLLRPDRGRVLVGGQDLTQLSEEGLFAVRRRFGYLFQHGALFDSLTVGENVAFPLTEHTDWPRPRIAATVAEKLSQVGLAGVEAKMPAEMSGGMLKRAALARALALDPEFLLFDEPTTGLDPIMTATIRRLIDDVVRRLKLTAVVISHDVEMALQLADSVAFLQGGQILVQAAPTEFQRSTLPQVQQFLRGEPDAGPGEPARAAKEI